MTVGKALAAIAKHYETDCLRVAFTTQSGVQLLYFNERNADEPVGTGVSFEIAVADALVKCRKRSETELDRAEKRVSEAMMRLSEIRALMVEPEGK